MSVLVVAEHDNTALKPATLRTVTAAGKLGGDIAVLVAGANCQSAADAAARIDGVARVLVADDACFAHGLAEELAALVAGIGHRYSHILAPASAFGKNFLPRAAAMLDVAQISDIVEIVAVDTFVHPIYAGNALATVHSRDPIKVISVRTTAFSAAGGGGSARIEPIAGGGSLGLSRLVARDVTQSKRPELTQARVVVAGGRGLGSRENFALLEPLADRLEAAIGATRAAVDAGFAPNDWQIGQTGKIVAPELYIALGISGAIQHVAGIGGAQIIVAVNKDEQAPIFDVADYGLVADLFQVLPELVAQLEKPHP